jgi:hypothetical protein
MLRPRELAPKLVVLHGKFHILVEEHPVLRTKLAGFLDVKLVQFPKGNIATAQLVYHVMSFLKAVFQSRLLGASFSQ